MNAQLTFIWIYNSIVSCVFTEVINLDICCHPATISNIYLSWTAPVSKVVTLSRLCRIFSSKLSITIL